MEGGTGKRMLNEKKSLCNWQSCPLFLGKCLTEKQAEAAQDRVTGPLCPLSVACGSESILLHRLPGLSGQAPQTCQAVPGAWMILTKQTPPYLGGNRWRICWSL